MLRQRVERELAALADLNEDKTSIFSPELAAALRTINCRVESVRDESPQLIKVTMLMTRRDENPLKIEVTYSDSLPCSPGSDPSESCVEPPTFHSIEGGPSLQRRCSELNEHLKNIWDRRSSDCFAASCFPYLVRKSHSSIEEKLESIKSSLSSDSTLIISIGCAGGARECQFLPPNCHTNPGVADQSPPVIVSECATPFPRCKFVTFCVGAARGSRHL
jgi:hypothetical protein